MKSYLKARRLQHKPSLCYQYKQPIAWVIFAFLTTLVIVSIGSIGAWAADIVGVFAACALTAFLSVVVVGCLYLINHLSAISH